MSINASGVGLVSSVGSISTVDNDVQGIIITQNITTIPEGGTQTFDVRLNAEPSPSLVVSFASNIPASAVTAVPSVTFDNVCPGVNCWSTNKTITINGLEDVNQSLENIVITSTAPATPTVNSNYTTLDNDITITLTHAATVNEGANTLLNVSLSGNPGTARTVTLASSNILAVTLSTTTLNFDQNNWNIPQADRLTPNTEQFF